jgi:hypothetical protein
MKKKSFFNFFFRITISFFQKMTTYTVIGIQFKVKNVSDLENSIRDENEVHDSTCLLLFHIDKHQVIVTTDTLCLEGDHKQEDFHEPTAEEKSMIEEVTGLAKYQLINFSLEE